MVGCSVAITQKIAEEHLLIHVRGVDKWLCKPSNREKYVHKPPQNIPRPQATHNL